LGPGIDALFNATFGNAAELIIALFGLRSGLVDVVKASITGTMIGNVLFVLGLALLVGGWGRERQRFSASAAGANSTMLTLAVIGLVTPAMFDRTVRDCSFSLTESLSLQVGAVLLVAYALYLYFSLRTHRHLYGPGEEHEAELSDGTWPVRRSILILVASTVGVAAMSET